MGEKNGKVSNLLEDGWFFGNTLLSCSNSSKSMVRCNSDPCSSSSNTKEEALDSHHQEYPSKMSSSSSLFRTPSLPPCWGRDTKYGLEDEEEEEEEEDEARMGDLIRQAMPLPRHNMMPIPRKRLDRTPSLPPCRVRDGTTNVISNDCKNDVGVGGLSRRESIDSSMLMKEKGSIAEVSRISRRASIDSSMLLPPKCNTSKGTKLSTSNSKNRPHRKMESSSLANNSQAKLDMKLEKLDICKSEKSLSDLEVEELQGFKDLGFSFDNQEELSPSVTQILPALQRRASLGSSNHHVDNNIGKVRRPYLSESWQKPLYTPPVPQWSDPKASSSSDDMKAQIKFWARAVASNVRQEC